MGIQLKEAVVVEGRYDAARVRSVADAVVVETDGFGIFPQKRPPYDVAFLFLDDNYADHMVPPWAMKLVLGTDDITKGMKR